MTHIVVPDLAFHTRVNFVCQKWSMVIVKYEDGSGVLIKGSTEPKCSTTSVGPTTKRTFITRHRLELWIARAYSSTKKVWAGYDRRILKSEWLQQIMD